jgi:hypothetical protein
MTKTQESDMLANTDEAGLLEEVDASACQQTISKHITGGFSKSINC